MWDTNQLPTTGNFSLRKIAASFLAVLLSAFLFAIISHSTVSAADVTWQGDNLQYNGKTYSPESETVPGIPAESTVYSSKSADGTSADIIYYPSNTDTSKEFQVQQAQVSLNGGQYTSPGPPSTISVDAKSVKEKTQCDIPGLGWMICPLSRYIATGMDNIFSIIAGYLEVAPLSNDKDSGLYAAWEIGLGFANLCFILAFLVIIYSQITSQSISNYNIKKMIPRLIVAAILVNVSYYICALAVDLSNIGGHAIQQALIDIRKSLPGNVSIDMTWQNVTEYVLSAGTIVAAGFAANAAFAGGAATGGSASALAFLLFPILVAGALAVLVVLLVLAARQALITVLIVVSPLAFVAYLLPNTEKWFEKWKDLFMTMLMVFPLFSLLFGGSQLASAIIMQNANQISVIIFAMFIQVAPLVITPFLIKFSGSLLGRLAGMVNNPQKGLIDRSRNWAKDKAEVQRAEGLKRAANGGGTRFQRSAYKREKDKLHREGRKKDAIAHVDAGWHNDARYKALHESGGRAEIMKKYGESSAEKHFESVKQTDRNLQKLTGGTRVNEAAVKQMQTLDESQWQEALSRNMQANNRYAANAPAARHILEQQHIVDGKVSAAQAMQKAEYANDLIKSEALQVAVGGIADHGAQRALASAVTEYRKDYNDRINEATSILKHYNLSGSQRQDHALGKEVVAYDDSGNMKILRADSVFTREAAIDGQLTTGTYQEIEQIVQRSGSELEPFKTTIASAIATNKLSQKAAFLGGKTIDDAGQGKITGMDKLMESVTATIARGKISATDLVTNENTALERIFEAARDRNTSGLNTEEIASLDANIAALKEAARTAMEHPTISQNLRQNSREVLEKIKSLP